MGTYLCDMRCELLVVLECHAAVSARFRPLVLLLAFRDFCQYCWAWFKAYILMVLMASPIAVLLLVPLPPIGVIYSSHVFKFIILYK